MTVPPATKSRTGTENKQLTQHPRRLIFWPTLDFNDTNLFG
jgi:hypothetical protein